MGLILNFFEIIGGTLDVGCSKQDRRKAGEEIENLKKIFEVGISSCQYQTSIPEIQSTGYKVAK